MTFIDDAKLVDVVSEMSEIMKKKHKLSSLERETVIRLLQRKESNEARANDMKKTLKLSKLAAFDAAKDFMMGKGKE